MQEASPFFIIHHLWMPIGGSYRGVLPSSSLFLCLFRSIFLKSFLCYKVFSLSTCNIKHKTPLLWLVLSVWRHWIRWKHLYLLTVTRVTSLFKKNCKKTAHISNFIYIISICMELLVTFLISLGEASVSIRCCDYKWQTPGVFVRHPEYLWILVEEMEVGKYWSAINYRITE